MSKTQSIEGIINAPKKTKSINDTSNWIKFGWLCMLFVIASIMFSSYMVYFGSTNMVAKIMIAPQILFAVGVAIYKFVAK